MVETKNPGHCKEVAISEAGGLTVFWLSVTIIFKHWNHARVSEITFNTYH